MGVLALTEDGHHLPPEVADEGGAGGVVRGVRGRSAEE